MNKDISFGMWGERGLVATFFADLYQKAKIGHMEIINDFLNTAEFPDLPAKSTEPPDEVHFIIEPDFANTGFGHPDAIFSVVYASNRIVVIVEAKRVNFEKACWTSSR